MNHGHAERPCRPRRRHPSSRPRRQSRGEKLPARPAAPQRCAAATVPPRRGAGVRAAGGRGGPARRCSRRRGGAPVMSRAARPRVTCLRRRPRPREGVRGSTGQRRSVQRDVQQNLPGNRRPLEPRPRPGPSPLSHAPPRPPVRKALPHGPAAAGAEPSS